MTAVIVRRGNYAFQEECDQKGIPDAVKRIRAFHPSAFRDGTGLTAEFVMLDARQQVVGKALPVDLSGYITAQ